VLLVARNSIKTSRTKNIISDITDIRSVTSAKGEAVYLLPMDRGLPAVPPTSEETITEAVDACALEYRLPGVTDTLEV
jgi:hypothetical protein